MNYLKKQETNRIGAFLLVLLPLPLILAGCASIQKHQVLSADNVSISYDVQGKGKPALVFIHGGSCDKSYWKYQVPYFSKHHKVVTIDLAGHGDSGYERDNWTIEAFGRDVVAVIEELNLKQVILIGHSLGGFVIIEAARQMPGNVIGLVGVDTLHDFEIEYTQEQIDEFIKPFEEDVVQIMKPFVRDMFAQDADPELVEWVVTDVSSARPEVAISSLKGYCHYDPKKALKDVRVPIYCINSDRNPTNVETNRRYASAFKVKIMQGVGHFVMMEDPETFNKLLSEAISELN